MFQVERKLLSFDRLPLADCYCNVVLSNKLITALETPFGQNLLKE